MNTRIAKLGIAAVVVAGAAAVAAVGVKYRYHFAGRGRDGTYHFTKDSEPLSSVSIGSNDPNFTIDVEQKRKDLEEVAALREMDARELVGVVDTEVNGHFHRTLRYQYTLSDGRTHTTGEGDPDARIPRTPEQIEKDREEIAQLRELGERELVGVQEYQIGDGLFRVCTFEYVLADGRVLKVGENDPEPSELPPLSAPLEPDRIHEIWQLRQLKEGDFLGYSDRDVHGQTFTFETFIFTLADGTVVTHAVGEPKGRKTHLSDADWEEFRQLRDAGAGEDLDPVEKVVKGQVFYFKPQLYVLSDGTEFIWAYGAPKSD